MLRFPNDWPSDRLVSLEAKDLILQLLQDREYRLCSSKYKINDFSPRARNLLYWSREPVGDYRGACVHANDATDIKSHPFFKGIKWGSLHTSRPPFVPKVKDWEDSRYFDDCCPLNEADDAATAAEAASKESNADMPVSPICEDPLWKLEPNKTPGARNPQNPLSHKEMEREKLKNRPRDKVLRDREVGMTALEIRKRGAFYGYTYHRPKTPVMAFSERKVYAPRGQMRELFGYL